MNRPKITVIIPCYNAEKYIENCLSALSKQTYRNFNVIIIDDCSTDCTFSKLISLENNFYYNIQIIKNEINLGPAKARNKAIERAIGEYIAFCDSDDWYEDNFLEKMVDSILDNDSDMVFCGYNVVDEKGIVEKRELINRQPKTICEALIINCDSLCMMLVKSEVMKETLLPDIRNGEDMAVIPLLIQKVNKVSVVPECLYNYFRRSDSASQDPKISSVYSLIESYNFLCQGSKKGFEKELEFIGVRNLVYSAEITLFTVTYNRKLANKILDDFEKVYPKWQKNKYIKTLPAYKKVILKCLKWRMFLIVKMIAIIRKNKRR